MLVQKHTRCTIVYEAPMKEKNPPDVREDNREGSELSSNYFAFRDACDATIDSLLSIPL